MELKDIKNWGSNVEKSIVEEWKNSEIFKFDENTKKKIYSIDTPPPYVNAPIHIGQAVTYCYMDFFARYKRMKGFEVLFPLGLDRNGLPIEMATEKKFGVSPLKTDRITFINFCKKLLEETSSETQDSFAKLGISFSSYQEGNHIGSVYKTDSKDYRKTTQSTFIELFRKGLIYEDNRINNWDPKLETTIADSEIEYKEISSDFNYVEWKVKETNEKIVIGTTRPELICTCGMIIFHPSDKRYKHLEGKTAISPLFKKEIPIKSNALANPNKGTGIVMMCSAGDLSDIQFFREQNLKPIIAINQDGAMNEHAGFLKGLKVREAREKIIVLLRENNLLIKQEKIMHRTPISERSGEEIEFIQMPEFYLKQLEFKNKIKTLAKKIKFYPEESRKILFDWISSINIDWPISRRRYYATPIPIWQSEINGNKVYALGEQGCYYEPWSDQPKNNFEIYKNGRKIGYVKDYKNLKWTGETRVFDTWMDSSISELILLKYNENNDFFKRSYPCSLRPQGKEIVRTWLYYTLLRGYLETKKSCFKDVWIHQHIVDFNGYKISKSKNNIINLQKLLRNYGAEAIRFWAAIEGDLSKQDLKCSEERIKAELKTLNKILNVSKFILQFKKPKEKSRITNSDKFFIKYINSLTSEIDKDYSKYDFYNPTLKLRNFLWEIFASHYIELVKARAYNSENKFSEFKSNSARYTLYYFLGRFLHLVYPILPQLTTTIGNELGLDLLNSKWPEIKKIKFNKKLLESLIMFNSEVWKKKKELRISLRNEISGIEVPKKLKIFKTDLIACHRLK